MKKRISFYLSSVIMIFLSLLIGCTSSEVEPTSILNPELNKFAETYHLTPAKYDPSVSPILTFKTLQEAEEYFRGNPQGLQLSVRKTTSTVDDKDKRARLAQGVYYTSGTYYLDNENQYGVKTLLLSINLSVVYDYCTGNNTFNSVVSHSSQGIRQSSLASLATWEEGSFFGWVYPNRIELDLRGKIAYKVQVMGYDFNLTDVQYSLLDIISSQEIPTPPDGVPCDGTYSGGSGGGPDPQSGNTFPTVPGAPIIIVVYPTNPTPTTPGGSSSPKTDPRPNPGSDPIWNGIV